MKSMLIVTRPGEGLGFRLAGARVEEVEPGAEEEALPALFNHPEVAMIIIDEEIAARAPESLLEQVARRGLPVLFPVALPHRWAGQGRAEAYVGMLVQRAIGYHVRLER